MLSATASDWLRMRYVFVLATTAVSLAGFVILLVVHDNRHLQYGALFLAAMGTYSAMPIIVCWFNTNRECSVGVQTTGDADIGGMQWADTIDERSGQRSRSASETVRPHHPPPTQPTLTHTPPSPPSPLFPSSSLFLSRLVQFPSSTCQLPTVYHT